MSLRTRRAPCFSDNTSCAPNSCAPVLLVGKPRRECGSGASDRPNAKIKLQTPCSFSGVRLDGPVHPTLLGRTGWHGSHPVLRIVLLKQSQGTALGDSPYRTAPGHLRRRQPKRTSLAPTKGRAHASPGRPIPGNSLLLNAIPPPPSGQIYRPKRLRARV